ncbi:hypothetical protein SmJEL517_g04733 [Synchytrium microbalum]|uniref:Uncharacterized protein n=1 Tax=Synchytrium microbalum TaxID=1806994 RepID=A0A507BY73_9FUNG|nr:uncharacterized protein SmJEL517_g04733 [Synchytrium microbalum]TPX32078.1 hypothetical protein SmJEL517_g04733 [Synchytrium microbalum]
MLQLPHRKFTYSKSQPSPLSKPSNNHTPPAPQAPIHERLVSKLRAWRNSAQDHHLYRTALYWADKIISITGNATDIWHFARICFEMGDAIRAEHVLKSFNLIARHVECRELAAQCLIKQDQFDEARTLLEQNVTGLTTLPQVESKVSEAEINVKARQLFLLGSAVLKLQKTARAQRCFMDALTADPRCYDALYSLIEHCSLREMSGSNLLQLVKFEQLEPDVSEFVKMLYSIKSRNKYAHDPDFDKRIDEFATLYRLCNNADILLSRAEMLLVRCRFQECLQVTTSILVRDPFNLETIPIHIACLYQLNMTLELYDLGHQLVDHYPKLAVSWFAVATYYLGIKKYEEARTYFSKSSLIDSNFGPAWIGFAHTFALSGENVRAINAYSSAARLFEKTHHPTMYIGMEHLHMKDFDLAEQYLTAARSICKFDPLLENELGVLYYEKQEYERAAEYFENAIQITGELHEKSLMWESTYSNQGHCYRNLKQHSKAKECFMKVLQINPASSNAMSALGLIHHVEGDLEKASMCYHNALAVNPGDIQTTELLDRVIEDSAAVHHETLHLRDDTDHYSKMLNQVVPEMEHAPSQSKQQQPMTAKAFFETPVNKLIAGNGGTGGGRGTSSSSSPASPVMFEARRSTRLQRSATTTTRSNTITTTTNVIVAEQEEEDDDIQMELDD